jgi:hypothetical protein
MLVFVSLLTLLIAPGHVAQASVGWCRSDPVVIIDDEVADIFLSAPADAPLKVTGPNEIIVTVPDTVSASAIPVPLGFGRGESVTVVHSPDLQATADGIEVTIDVYVPSSDDAMPVRVEFAPRVAGLLSPASAEGLANTWITLSTQL